MAKCFGKKKIEREENKAIDLGDWVYLQSIKKTRKPFKNSNSKFFNKEFYKSEISNLFVILIGRSKKLFELPLK